MIVPSDRLLVLFALVLLPAAIVAPGGVFLLVCALFAAIATVDAVSALRRVGAVRVAMPEIVRMVQTRPAQFAATLQSTSALKVRLALRVADAVGCEPKEAQVRIAAAPVGFPFQCKPVTRGTYMIDLVAIGVQSKLMLWEARRRIAAKTELRVYPDLLTGQKSLAPLLTRRQAGLHVHRQVGKGREFEKLREYLPGDAMSDIHWKATARRAKPVTRVFQIERTQEIYAVLDCSRLTGRPAGPDTILDRYVTSSLALNLVTRQQGDLYGLITFSDSVHSFLRAGRGSAHYDACRQALLNLKPRLVAPDYGELFAAIQGRLRRRALLVILTELDDPVLAEDFQSGVTALIRRHLVAAASVQDVSALPLFVQSAASTPELYKSLAGHMSWRRLEELRVRLRAVGIQFAVVDASDLGLETAKMYLNVKRQQAL